MNRKNACLCLLLVLMATWIDRLASGTFVVAAPTRTPAFGEEIYTLAMRDRDENRQTIEAPPLVGLNPARFALPAAATCGVRFEQAIPRILSSADVCYLLMSLQR